MAEGFIALAAVLRAQSRPPATAPQAPVAAVPSPSAFPEEPAFAHAGTLEELVRMRLAAFEAFERAKLLLLAGLAREVLARELALAPVDIEALAARLLAQARDLEPVLLRVAPGDAQRLRSSLPTRSDPSLRTGDVVVEVRDGSLESYAQFRLEAVVERALEART